MVDKNGDGWADDISWLDFVPGGWLLRQATGNFGQDNADAIERGFEKQDARLAEAQAATQAAGTSAQAGLDPYAQAGTDALQQMRSLAGLNGEAAQRAALEQIQSSPGFMQSVKASEDAILANASATGGLRGGNVQAALAQARPAMLDQYIANQYAQFNGLRGAGQDAAAQQGAFGLNGAGMTADLLAQRGAAAAGNEIGRQAALQQGQDQAIGYGLQGIGVIGSIATGSLGGFGGLLGGQPRTASGGLQPYGAF